MVHPHNDKHQRMEEDRAVPDEHEEGILARNVSTKGGGVGKRGACAVQYRDQDGDRRRARGEKKGANCMYT